MSNHDSYASELIFIKNTIKEGMLSLYKSLWTEGSKGSRFFCLAVVIYALLTTMTWICGWHDLDSVRQSYHENFAALNAGKYEKCVFGAAFQPVAPFVFKFVTEKRPCDPDGIHPYVVRDSTFYFWFFGQTKKLFHWESTRFL